MTESRQVRRARDRSILKELQQMEKRRIRREKLIAKRNKNKIGATLSTMS